MGGLGYTQYGRETSKERCIEKYGQLVKRHIIYIRSNKHPNLILDENGLIRTNGRDKAVTWMNSIINGRPAIPRSGYIVEFNALWYNALKFAATIATDMGEPHETVNLKKWLQSVKRLLLKRS